MRIRTASIEDFKRIKFARITPSESGVFVIGGKNGNGKSSLIDALVTALGGQKLAPKEPVRRGADRAEISVETTDDFIIRQYFTSSGGYGLQVKRADGAVYPRGQTFLDQFYSRLTFDPLAFLRMKESDQIATLKAAIGLDFSDLDLDRKKAYDERTLVNREVAQYEADLKNYPFDDSAPAEAVSISEIAEKLRAANEANAKRSKLVQAHDGLSARVSSIDERIQALEEEIQRLKAERSATIEEKDRTRAKLADTPRIDTADLETQLREAESTNERVRSNARRNEIHSKLVKAKTQSSALTDRIEKIDAQKAEMISKAKAPVPGLTFNDDGLFLNGLPFDQASGAEKLRASFALAFAQKTGLEVVFSNDGSLLDPESLAILDAEANRAGFQVILERVGEDDQTSIVIEDGEVRGAEPAKGAEELFD